MERYIFHILKGIVLKLQAPVKEPGCKYVISQRTGISSAFV